MGTVSVHQHSEVRSVSADSKRGCSRCELLFSLPDRYISNPELAHCFEILVLLKRILNLLVLYLFINIHLIVCMHSYSGSAPLTAVQLLWVNMIMDTLGALALATEPPNDELMKRTPVGRKGNFISNIMWRNILGQSFYQFLVIWYLQTEGKWLFGINGANSDLVLNTLIFNCFVFCQVISKLNVDEFARLCIGFEFLSSRMLCL